MAIPPFLERALSQEGFAHLCGFDRTYISGIERGFRNPSLSAIEILAKALNTTVAQLFSGLCNLLSQPRRTHVTLPAAIPNVRRASW